MTLLKVFKVMGDLLETIVGGIRRHHNINMSLDKVLENGLPLFR